MICFTIYQWIRPQYSLNRIPTNLYVCEETGCQFSRYCHKYLLYYISMDSTTIFSDWISQSNTEPTRMSLFCLMKYLLYYVSMDLTTIFSNWNSQSNPEPLQLEIVTFFLYEISTLLCIYGFDHNVLWLDFPVKCAWSSL